MKRLLIILLSCAAVGISAQELAPARRGPIIKVQPDGDTLTVIMRGNEWHHYMLTIDHYRVQEGKKGYIYYSQKMADGNLEPSKQKAHNPEKRKKKEIKWLHKYGVLR